MKRTGWLLFTLGIILCLSAAPASAGIIFNDFGPGFSYNCCTGWTASGADSFAGEWESANLFTAAISGAVDESDVAIGWEFGGSGGATVSLWTDSGGLPGVQLGAWNVTAGESFGNCCGVVTITGISGVNLTAGQSYFMLVVAGDATTYNVWNWNNQGATGLQVHSQDGGSTWNVGGSGVTLGAFDLISAATVPEPATMTLVGAGLLGLMALRRKR